MHKVLKSVIVASLAVSALTSCSTVTAPATKGLNVSMAAEATTATGTPSATPSATKTATPTASATPKASSAATAPTTTAPASSTKNGVHPIAVGLSISANTQVQPQPAPATCHVGKAANGQPLPDPNCTPGTTNPAVTQDNLSSTICKSGYTSDIRPSTSITSREKAANAASYGYTGPLGDTEYDHLISLQLGGSSNDPKNLWVEPGGPNWVPADKFRNDKDGIENKMNALVCSHQVTLAAAQSAIANDWTTAIETAKANS